MKLSETVHFDWYKKAFTFCVLLVFVWASAVATDANVADVMAGSSQAGVFLAKFLQPDFSYLPKLVDPMVKTIQMSVLGTAVGVLVAVPLAFLATTTVTHNKALTWVFRVILDIIRTIPTLLLAALAVAILGIGEFTGVVTIAIFTLGVVSQLVFEAVESVDEAPIEAMTAVGANRVQVAIWAIFPQVMSQIASYTFYAFEINVRASTVLGYVGAGGIGTILNSQLGLFRYDRVSVVILMILVVVIVVDFVSEMVRRRLK